MSRHLNYKSKNIFKYNKKNTELSLTEQINFINFLKEKYDIQPIIIFYFL